MNHRSDCCLVLGTLIQPEDKKTGNELKLCSFNGRFEWGPPPAIDKMAYCHDRMSGSHARPRVFHHFSDSCSHVRPVTMHPAFGTCSLTFLKWAILETFYCEVNKLFALKTWFIGGVMMATVERNHHSDSFTFPCDSRRHILLIRA